jgi:hypothetical protein
MKRALAALFMLLSVGFVFWPWVLAGITAVQWFFDLPPLYDFWGDPARVVFALSYPLGAIFVWGFGVWLLCSVLEN